MKVRAIEALLSTMSKLKQSEVAKVCANIFKKFDDPSDRSEIVKSFIIAGIPTTTAYRQYTKLMLGESQCKPGTGLGQNKLTSANEAKIKRLVCNRVFCGYRAVGRKIGVAHKTAKVYMKKLGINVQKRKKAPRVSKDQEQRQKTRLRHLRYLIQDSEIVMDDESYFDLEGYNFSGADRFAFEDEKNVPREVRYRMVSKFGPKLMIWIAIGSKGYCSPYFHLASGALNSSLYIKYCLLKRLIPWIKSEYENENVLF